MSKYPPGKHPNSLANLKKNKLQKGLPAEHQRAIQKKGTATAATVNHANGSITAALKELVTEDVARELAHVVVNRARHGNLKAWELARDTLGEKPVEKQSLSIDPGDKSLELLEGFMNDTRTDFKFDQG